ncbi:HtpA [Mycoplasma phage MAV1]|uniref:Uncharacterized protein n=3 Tax=Metamycoplasma arthritidis TaxID=2111 RepID=B3PNB3_META1|nr:hypothetical protein [Metamycoplasma arthritidis]NP_047266.1 HtpA [Mycoplasma phage MAV1]AAC33776.1 HtpA [Mycoplasma phage MAV1]ACF07515.1 bacteriophage MAV1 hypothetical protein [Metamycoplasma arthritidis 158L3-1]
MLSYGKNLISRKAIPLKPKSKGKPWWYYVVDIVLDLIIEALSLAVGVLSAGAASGITRLGLGLIKDITLSSVFDRKINWKDVFLNAGLNLVFVGIGKSLSKFSKISKSARLIKKFAFYAASPQKFLNWIINKATYGLKKTLINTVGQVAGKKITKFLRTGLKLISKTAIITSAFLLAKNKAEFAYKNIKTFAIRKFKNLLTKSIRRQFTKNFWGAIKGKKLKASGYNQILQKHNQTWIPFPSSKWIEGVKIASDNWIFNDDNTLISYYVFFKSRFAARIRTTVQKDPLIFIDRPIEEFNDFLSSGSKGKFYLDELAWGWELGKAIRNQSKKPRGTKFYINSLEKENKYNKHFLASLKEFDTKSNLAVEEFRNQFKVLSTTRRRKLGNKIVVEFKSGDTRFYGRIPDATKFNSKFGNKFQDFRKTTKNVKLVKTIKKL